MKIRNLFVVLTLALAVTASRCYAAPETTTPAKPKPAQKQTLQEIWVEILRAQDAMAKTITAKKLGEVEISGFKIAGLAYRLPTLSEKLAPEKMASLKELIKKVQQIAGDLDNTGDSNNLPGTEANAKKMDDVLKEIRALYPEGTLPDKVPDTTAQKPTANQK